MNTIIQILLDAKRNLAKIQSGKMIRNEAILKYRLTEEEENILSPCGGSEKGLWKLRESFDELLGDSWSVYWTDSDVELEKDFSQEELDKYTMMLFPRFSASLMTTQTLEKVAAKAFPDKPRFEAVRGLLESADMDSFTVARSKMTVEDLLDPYAEIDETHPYFITESKWKELMSEPKFLEQLV